MNMNGLLHIQWMNRWSRELSLAFLVFACLLFSSAVVSGWRVWSTWHALQLPAVPVPVQPANPPRVAYQQVAEAHLFGRATADNAAALPETHLQLELTGLLAEEGASSPAMAIISVPGQAGQVVRVGDTLPSGVRVNAITREAVILENGGHLERLILQRSPLEFERRPESIFGR